MSKRNSRLTITVELGLPGEGLVEDDVEVEYDFTPGEKGCRYTANGDGWPDEGPEIEILSITRGGTDVAKFVSNDQRCLILERCEEDGQTAEQDAYLSAMEHKWEQDNDR